VTDFCNFAESHRTVGFLFTRSWSNPRLIKEGEVQGTLWPQFQKLVSATDPNKMTASL